ncbi:hypothetical protein Tco_0434570 [Tanacetum coccineum]
MPWKSSVKASSHILTKSSYKEDRKDISKITRKPSKNNKQRPRDRKSEQSRKQSMKKYNLSQSVKEKSNLGQS